MGLFDKMLDALKIDDEDDEYYDDEEFDEEEEEPEVKEKKHFFFRSKSDKDEEEEEVLDKPVRSSKITPMRSRKDRVQSGMEVCVIKPTSFDDAREIAETLMANRTIILNMEGLDLGIAQRLIDFISGTCYAVNGNLQTVSNYIFVVTPRNVDVSGDFQDIMDAFDFSGIKTTAAF